MKKIVTLLLPLVACTSLAPSAAPAAPGPDAAPEPITVETEADLRALSEIDGDPNTLSLDERRKMALLRQVLDLPSAPMPLSASAETP